MRVLPIVFGVLIALSVILAWAWRIWAQKEFIIRATETVSHRHRRRQSRSYMAILREEAEALGEPEKADLWVRMATIGSVLLVSVAILLRTPIALFGIPVAFILPLMYVRGRKKGYLRLLREQTRLSQILIAFLMRAGATLADTFSILERKMESPMRDKIREVNIKKRYTTLPGALAMLGESTGVSQIKDFSMVVAESERYGTPVSEALLRSLQLDTKIRDAQASKRYGNVQLELGLYATLLIAMPGFGFVIVAMVSYLMKSIGGITFG